MAFLVSDVTKRVREHLSAFYLDTEPQALETVNEAHASIVRECGLYPAVAVDVPLVAGVGQYALDPDVYIVQSATYKSSDNGSWPLKETSVDELDHTMPLWRELRPSQPYRYYEQGGLLGFHPAPSVTTVGTYPLLRLWAIKRNAFTSLSDPLPPQVDKIDAWVWETCARWAVRNDEGQIAKFVQLSQSAQEDLKRLTMDRLIRQKPRAVPAFRQIRNL